MKPEMSLAKQLRATQENMHLKQPLSSNVNLKAETHKPSFQTSSGDQEQEQDGDGFKMGLGSAPM